MITIVDSGGANVSSILFALERLGSRAIVTTDAAKINNASHVILPGVGSADKIMQRLINLKLDNVLRSLKQPVLGICVGMQVLFEFSQEGNTACLKLIPGTVNKLKAKSGLILPHMGWNTLEFYRDCALLKLIPNNSYVYFVHSFAAPILNSTCAITHHGDSFSAIVQHQNFFGTQFHPERSGVWGSQILKNFLGL